MNPFSVVLAVGLDALLGDPPNWSWHPVRLMGRLVTWSEPYLRVALGWPFLAGLVLAVGLPLLAWDLGWVLTWGAGLAWPSLALAVSAVLLYFCFSTRDLASHAKAVAHCLDLGDLAAARQEVAKMVGRDTQDLDEEGVLRAAIESVAESSCDAVVAPLFYALLGGAPLCLAYKAVSTLDSMVGYKNERYARFGMASARLDDLFNLVPARLCAFLTGLAACLMGHSALRTWRTAWQDGPLQPSPNSGWPEAAFAGALEIQLGGLNHYQGQPKQKALMGQKDTPLTPFVLRQCVQLMVLVSFIALALGLGIALLFGRPWQWL